MLARIITGSYWPSLSYMTLPLALQPLFTWSYWLMASPPPFGGVGLKLVAGTIGGGFALGLVLRLVTGRFHEPSTRVIVRRLGACFMTVSVLTAMSLGFTQTTTPTLGSRFWFAWWFLVALIWLGFILRYALTVAPRERAARAKQAELAKYLPRSN